MTKATAKELTIKYLDRSMTEYGFKLINTKNSDVHYTRVVDGNIQGMYLHFKDYNPIQKTAYYFYIKHKSILDICKSMVKEYGSDMDSLINKDTMTTTFSYASLNHINNEGVLHDMTTESDVEKACDIIKEFMINDAFPLLDRFNDLRELDKMVNGKEYSETEYMRRPFNLGGNDAVKQLIIGYLVGGVSRLDDVVTNHREENLRYYQKENIEYTEYELSGYMDDLDKPLGFTKNYLIANIKPLY